MTYVVAILLLVLAVSSSVLLVGLVNTRRPSRYTRTIAVPTATTPAPTPARRGSPHPLPKPPPLSDDSLSLREIDRSFTTRHRFHFEARLGQHGRG